MPAENAQYISQLVKTKPTGGESISDGDDHLRAIKTAVHQSFPNISSQVDATPADLNAVSGLVTDVAQLKTDIGDIDADAHGNVASCYWNPTFSPKLAYAHNVADVIKDPADPYGMQTRVVFSKELDSIPGSGAAHFSFSITPVSGTGYPTLVTVVGAAPTHVSFLAWHLVGDAWMAIPGTELGFSFMVNDMDKSQ
jgi:hypothetical protein